MVLDPIVKLLSIMMHDLILCRICTEFGVVGIWRWMESYLGHGLQFFNVVAYGWEKKPTGPYTEMEIYLSVYDVYNEL